MLNPIRKKIEGIRNSGETTKKYWIIVFSVVTMAIVVVVWFFYAGFTVKTAEKKTVSAGFWPVFKNSFLAITDSLKEKFYDLILKERTISL
ncbi:MAG: hypothetical protein AAB498_01725 [Patescibacteria group bacterium]